MVKPVATARRIQHVIVDNSLLLVAGTVVALVWANLHAASYERVAHALRFAANDVGMVFFFGLATKEVYEAMLPGGALASPRQAAVPVLAGVGFTVSLFFATAAFPDGGRSLSEAKMGAVASFVALPVAILLGRALGIRRS